MVISFCGNCGLAFGSSISISNSQNITLKNNFERCPRCGSMAKVMEGTFNFRENAVEVLNAPWSTIDKLRELEAILKKLNANEISQEKALSEAEKIDPDAASKVREWINTGAGVAAAVATIAIAIMTYQSSNAKKHPTEGELRALVEQVVNEQALTQVRNQKVVETSRDQNQPENRKARRAKDAKARRNKSNSKIK